jgi:hypothetical protein
VEGSIHEGSDLEKVMASYSLDSQSSGMLLTVE